MTPPHPRPRPRKRLGQHFLTDPRILGRIADAAGAGRADTVVEIGPGPGGLTAELANRAGRVVAIEKDAGLAAALAGRWPNVSVVTADALEQDWAALAGVPSGAAGPVPHWLVVGNIPYNLTSPLIEKALAPPAPARIAFLVQREVAERVTAPPGTPEYGALGVGVQAVAGAEQAFRVPAGAFTPRPRVDSALLRLTPLAAPLVRDAERGPFRRMVVGLFGFRRKQMLRGVRELTGWPAEAAARALAAAGVAETARPETLPPAAFVRLLRALVDGGWGGA
ncbi:MAG TPA: 16S rRNA (adenine(1518)-N(6)/adenine(1519)-N(6))-dimethyltransferase RsmA [Gemmatimonadales bacterium]|nr:16S rRNA (adenine(1518)-N(6)/adenine(1519)-N(6))-dimethyltransferase RsmA [Gemmatimonadales bacterium]